MQALVLKEANKVSLENFPLAEAVSPTDVRVGIKNIGICGSDIHYYLHGKIGDFVVKEPMILGHEGSGIVLEVGEEVKHLKVGDRVCMEPGIPSSGSKATLSGKYNLDPAVKFWATPPIHGILRETVVHPANFTFKLPENVSLEEGALVEPLAIGIYSAATAQIRPGDVAVVFGAGTIGIVTALAAVSSGCSRVVLCDIKQKKLDIVRENFTSNIFCINTAKESLEDILSTIAPEGADIVFEASGSPVVVSSIMKYISPAGRIIMIGMPAEPVSYNVVAAQAKEVEIRHIFRYRNMFPRTLNMISSGIMHVKPLITHRYSFKNVIEAFQFASKMREDAIKVMIQL
ncbi:MAG TPA: NAD(P)-dependent alcohol dehydrogenase [Spirochaetales bacterium]|nr:NAD(P)-dependent alcohol dehydrogenase [Spirochaetales bacterium]